MLNTARIIASSLEWLVIAVVILAPLSLLGLGLYIRDLVMREALLCEITDAVYMNRTSRVQSIISAHPEVINLADNQGWTPIHEAARVGNLPAARILVAARADCASRNSDGRTALEEALRAHQRTMVKFLRDCSRQK